MTHSPERNRNLPPIVGSEDGSTRFGGDFHVTVPDVGDFARNLADGFYAGFDLQPEASEDMVVLGSGTSERTAVCIELNWTSSGRELEITIRDDRNRTLSGRALTSRSRAKRIVCTGSPAMNTLNVYELQPWTSSIELPVTYVARESPVEFSNFAHPLIFAGWNLDGIRQGKFTGRLANVYIGNGVLPRSDIDRLREASDNPTNIPEVQSTSEPTVESRNLFLSDLVALDSYSSKGWLSDSEFRNVSTILNTWLFEPKPLLIQLAQRTGMQLWLPGESDHGRQFRAVLASHSPVYHQTGAHGSRNRMGFKWVTVASFKSEIAFGAGGYDITHEQFVKFVRNKLGAGHFDEVDRRKWQRELLEVTKGLELVGQPALNRGMLDLTAGVLEGIAACGLQFAVSTLA